MHHFTETIFCFTGTLKSVWWCLNKSGQIAAFVFYLFIPAALLRIQITKCLWASSLSSLPFFSDLWPFSFSVLPLLPPVRDDFFGKAGLASAHLLTSFPGLLLSHPSGLFFVSVFCVALYLPLHLTYLNFWLLFNKDLPINIRLK